jgi:hypothetical protein
MPDFRFHLINGTEEILETATEPLGVINAPCVAVHYDTHTHIDRQAVDAAKPVVSRCGEVQLVNATTNCWPAWMRKSALPC